MKAVKADEITARLLAALPAALVNGQLVAYFQPEVELATGQVIAAEALVRWEHPELGTLSPAQFLPLAQQLGLMDDLTRLMLRLSLAAQRAWAARGWRIPVSLNVGPECVTDPEFPSFVAESLHNGEVPGSMLTIEVSEQTATTAVSSSFFAQFADIGVRIALDDFGTGFASLESLGGWPVDELKLDISLVRPMAGNVSFRTIVGTTIDLAHQLGARVVAEGVESDVVRDELQALGCDFGQGFLFGRPMTAEGFAGWLAATDPQPRRRGAAARLPAPHPPAPHPPAVPRPVPEPFAGVWDLLARAIRRAGDRAGRPSLTAAAVMLAAYGLWQIFRWGCPQHQELIGDLAFVPVNGAAALYAGRASRRRALGRATCRAWRLLSAALWLFLLGDLIQMYYEVVRHERAYPTWADAAYLSFYLVAFAGLLTFPSRRRTRLERLRLLLDLGTVFAGGATFIWYVALGPAVAWARGFDLANLVTFAYPVGDLLLLFGVLTLLWRGVPRPSITPLRICASGLIVFIAADVSYDWITVHSSYRGGDPVDTLWIIALLVLFIAASCQLRAEPSAEFPRAVDGRASRPSVLPYLAVAASYALLTVVGLRGVPFDPLGGILLGAVVLAVLVSLRQFTALRDYSRLAGRYQALASIDGITGLYTRRHFMEVAEGLFAHAHRLGQPLAALMMDVDHFKQINDAYGHAVGDRVLADLARSCREQVRPDDVLGRYGGDEFAVVIPGVAAAGAAQIAARLTGPPSRVTARDGALVPFTVSVGVADATGCRDLKTLLARADYALYEAKRNGRARWHAFDGKYSEARLLPHPRPD